MRYMKLVIHDCSIPKSIVNVRNGLLWSGRLDIRPVPISMTPSGLPGYTCGRVGMCVCGREVVLECLEEIEKSGIGPTDCGWICLAWSGRE
ncbi:hypothetical protein AVEN_135139-1 [Araneus ventricosus]|uniref:Uncharacterized protein n=1 Tax=Araneus ventricosus TaxID=182803 RepID=A0A4Y2MWC4_ARAVE|nr:hypothetical protein AVEN_135139-1 [Araneus ventricosus]